MSVRDPAVVVKWQVPCQNTGVAETRWWGKLRFRQLAVHDLSLQPTVPCSSGREIVRQPKKIHATLAWPSSS
jgi:hypothetical protein